MITLPITSTLTDLAAERGVLGCVLMAPSHAEAQAALDKAGIEPDHFCDPYAREVFGLLNTLLTDGEQPDLMHLDPLLKTSRADIGALRDFTTGLQDATPSFYNLEHYAEHLRGLRARREAIEVADSIRARALDLRGSVAEAQDLARQFADMPLVRKMASTIPDSRSLGDLVRHDGCDPDELLKHRYLCRGGILLLAGPSGIGKSSFSMQCMLLWAIGREAFGIKPAGPLKSLLIQAENDDGDLAEQRDGVLAGLNMRMDERAAALANVIVCREDTRSGGSFFLDVCKPLLTQHKPDLMWIDPVLAYLGGDTSSQKDVGAFLRNGLNPLLHEFNVGCVCIHHTNKPPSGKEKSTWQAGDMAYLGSGSAEWANAPRAVLAIRSMGSHDIFELNAGKRGSRLNWRDDQDVKVYSILIQHSKEPGQICWVGASKDDLEQKGRPPAHDPEDMLELLKGSGLTTKEWQHEAQEEFGMKESTFYRLKKAICKDKKATKSHVNGKWIRA